MYRARGRTLLCIMGRKTFLIHPLRIFAIGRGNSRPTLLCVAASKRRGASRPSIHRTLLCEICFHFPLARTFKYSHSRLRQKANPKITPREEGKLDSGLPGAAFVRGFTSRNWVVRVAERIFWRAAGAVLGSDYNLYSDPCLCNRLTLNQSVRERTVFL